jgi:hypothetical protein
MRPRPFLTAATLVLAVALVAAGPSAAAKKGKPKKFTCTLALTDVSAPTSATFEDFGAAHCSKVFGTGIQHDTGATTLTSTTTASSTGTFKDFFDTGTIHGTFTIRGTLTGATAVTYIGTGTITGGTGAFKHVRGTATFTGSSSDAGAHSAYTAKVKLTHT